MSTTGADVPEPARVIAGRYELTHIIKTGGMGQVWRGYDTTLDRPIAVKLISPNLAHSLVEGETLAARFRREARVTARLEHFGVPAVYDASIDADLGQLYIVMQLVNGTDLFETLRVRGCLPVSWVVAIAAQVCSVLAHAHALPVVHRDLKPGNLMIDADGVVKVLDFGIAAILRPDATLLTRPGKDAPGTYEYMSPEQIMGAKVTPQTDLYALGCVTFELFTGSRPFTGGVLAELMDQHRYAVPPSVRETRPEVPEKLAALVTDLLAKEPARRPASAQEVYERLVPFLPRPGPSTGDGDGASDPTRPFRTPLAPSPRRVTPVVPVESLPRMEDATPSRTDLMAIELAEAEEHAYALIDEERYSQAVGVLIEAIEPARSVLGSDDPRVLELRRMYAGALLYGRNAREALPEYLALASAYGRASGLDSQDALDMAVQAALCQSEMGEGAQAVDGFRKVLARIPDQRDPYALDVRRYLVIILVSARDPDAEQLTRELHADLLARFGPDDPRTTEVRELLARLDA